MSEPITAQKSLIVPNTSDLPGAWGTSALNPNFQTLDALLGGTTTISLSVATTLLLTVPATTGVWPGSLSQSVNSLITFTGAQTGNAIIQFTLPGFYIIHNQCTGTSYVQLANQSGAGNKIGAQPGKKTHVFFDGTDMDYVNPPDPGIAYDFHTNTTALPPWMLACTKSPYLIKDGSTYSVATYPALAQYLGSTFGGNGINTFAVPDERNRMRVPVDTVQAASGTTSNRIVTSFNGKTLGTSGGLETSIMTTGNLPSYTPAGAVNVGGQQAISGYNTANTTAVFGGGGGNGIFTQTGPVVFSGIPQGGTSLAFTNVPPAIVSFLALIKT